MCGCKVKKCSWLRHLGTQKHSIAMGLKMDGVGEIWVVRARGQGGEVEVFSMQHASLLLTITTLYKNDYLDIHYDIIYLYVVRCDGAYYSCQKHGPFVQNDYATCILPRRCCATRRAGRLLLWWGHELQIAMGCISSHHWVCCEKRKE